MLGSYRRTWLDSLLGRNRQPELEVRLLRAQELDARDTAHNQRFLKGLIEDWQSDRDFALRMTAREPAALLETLGALELCGEDSVLGTNLRFQVENGVVVAHLHAHGESTIPTTEKRLLKSGKVSAKKMTKSRFYALHQDVVAGALFRVAREVFGATPLQQALLHAEVDLLDSATGHVTKQTVISVAVTRARLAELRFESIDPSDALQNFEHRQKFLKTKGFRAVAPLTLETVCW